MTSPSTKDIRPLPLLDLHKERGARLVEFAGWQVPIYFSSILDEHSCVRDRAGLFDISHMGYFTVKGKQAREFLDNLLSASLEKLEPGKAVYSLLTNEKGQVLDDVIVYQKGEADYFLIVNAGTTEKDWKWIGKHKPQGVQLEDLSRKKVLLACQGPAGEFIVSDFFKKKLSGLARFEFEIADYQGNEVLLSRTGYTGEDGFEILAPLELGSEIWKGLLQVGASHGMEPVGFGARDTLRLEARYLLYSHDMDESVTPLQAGLGWAVDLNKEFIGSAEMKKQKAQGWTKRLIGFEVLGRVIPREGYELYWKGKSVGKVTSGCLSPTTRKSIGLGYLDTQEAVKEDLEIKIRGELYLCRIIKGPFYIGESLKKFSKKL